MEGLVGLGSKLILEALPKVVDVQVDVFRRLNDGTRDEHVKACIGEPPLVMQREWRACNGNESPRESRRLSYMSPATMAGVL